jgi:hypothetical protein
MRHAAFLPVVLALAAGCSRDASSSDHAATHPGGSTAATATAPTAPAGTLLLGERITSSIVPLADLARNPARYEGQLVATRGKVTAVCQEMGCWMEIQDAAGQAHVRMHGHSFFVPKTASGRMARVQAKIVKAAGGDDDCAEKAEGASLAKIELDATGVELD